LSWDFDNKLASADIDANGTADVSFQYDALGRRVARTGTGGSFVFVQMDQQTIADYPVGGAASTPTYRYVYASYIDEPVVRKGAGTGGTILYYHRNQQYSITAITTSTGAVAERYAYTAYGQATILDASASVLSSSAINNRYTYTGREWDATLALHHFRARWMSPIAGRFLSRDPIGYFDRVGLYECGLRLNALDPRGLSVERKLSCEEFLLNVEFLDITGWPSDAKKQFQGGAQVFCGACTPYQNYSWNVNGRCTICLGNATKYYSQEWEAAIIHELTHCEQSKCFGKGAPSEVLPLPLPPPRFGAPSDKACFDCRSLEGKAWQAQCGHLFPDDAAKRNQCIEAGKCYSCKFACSQTQGIVKKCKNVAFPNFTPKEIPLTSTPLTPPIVPIDPPDYSKLPLWNFPDPKL
jgi:RHS repeat-associated protein